MKENQETQIEKEKEMKREAQEERSRISDMFEAAEDKRDWPGEYFPLRSKAKAA